MNPLLPVLAIPGLVPYPGHTVHLHIFEPRYRSLVQVVRGTSSQEVLVAQGVPLGCADPVATKSENAEEFFNSNHRIYEPVEIGGIGCLKVREECEDGRFLIAIEIKKRVRLIHQSQRIPFVSASFQYWEDILQHESAGSGKKAGQASEVALRLCAILRKVFDGQRNLKMPGTLTGFLAEFWDRDPGAFNEQDLGAATFKILEAFVLHPDDGQLFLENRCPFARAEVLLKWIGELEENRNPIVTPRPQPLGRHLASVNG